MAKIKFDMEEAFKTIPEEPKGFKDFCIRQFVPIAIFYRRNGKLSDCTCGKCGENFVTDNVPVRKAAATCPVCGHKEWKRDVKQHWDDRAVGMVQRTTDNNIVIRLYRIHRHFQQYTVAAQTITECRRYFLYLGDAFKVYNGSVYTSRGWERRWGEKECKELWIENLYPGWKAEIENSNLKYFDADSICGKRTNDDEKVKGMIAFANNPAIEMYAKSGMKGLVRHLVAKEGKTKYVNRRGKVRGYYSGYTFANQIGLSLQVPYVQEIVTNEASAKVREIDIKGQKFIIRKPKAEVTEENVYTLQFLDFLSDIDKYLDGSSENILDKLEKLIKDEKITKELIDTYISLYPTKVYKNLYETGVVYAIAQG